MDLRRVVRIQERRGSKVLISIIWRLASSPTDVRKINDSAILLKGNLGSSVENGRTGRSVAAGSNQNRAYALCGGERFRQNHVVHSRIQ